MPLALPPSLSLPPSHADAACSAPRADFVTVAMLAAQVRVPI